MAPPLHHPDEAASNAIRDSISRDEPRTLRTYTPTQAVLSRSAGVYHWTPEGRRLFDFTSGVLVTNLGHNPTAWLGQVQNHLGWAQSRKAGGFSQAVPLNAYNAITEVEAEATRRLIGTLQDRPGGARLEQVLWAASGSEAIQKALWAALARDPKRDLILATRFGFHGKKGLAGAVSGSETDHDRDPRVRFISFPMAERVDVSQRGEPFDLTPYRRQLEALWTELGSRLGTLITEPYLGGAGSYHPPREYLHLLERFCRQRDMVFILDEVQSNFGRTRSLFAYETYGLEPDIVVLGKGLGNGVPVAAAVGPADLFGRLDYGEGSDTWSANSLSAAGVLATLEEFTGRDILGPASRSSAIIEAGLVALKELPFVAHVRGEESGMVWGLEMRDHAGRSAADWANAVVVACYRGSSAGDGIHLMGPLAKKVLRIAPPVVITPAEATEAMQLMKSALRGL